MKKAETKDRIREALEIREMKQAELVEKTGIDKGQMSSYLAGRYNPKQNNLHLIAEALSVDEAWLMGYDVPMERNDYEGPYILMRDTKLEDIEKILESDGYFLCCENYDDDFFIVKNAYGQTVASFYNYELLARYESLKMEHKLTAKLLISSNSVFFKYLESLGYYIENDGLEDKPVIHCDNDDVQITLNQLDDIKSRIDTYVKAILDSVILKVNENKLKLKRLEKEKTIKHLQNTRFEKDQKTSHLEPLAAHHRTDIDAKDITEEMKQHDIGVMDDPDF